MKKKLILNVVLIEGIKTIKPKDQREESCTDN